MVTKARQVTGPRVHVVTDADGLAAQVARVLEVRGIRTFVSATVADAVAEGAGPVAYAPTTPPTPDDAAVLAPACARAAAGGHPVAVLAAYERAGGDAAARRAAALAHLRAHGAVVCADPDTWLELLALLSAYGLPPGPRVAVVAPPGTWLALSATALASEPTAAGDRAAPLYRDAAGAGPADVALVDRAELAGRAPTRVGNALVVPVVGRAEALVAGSAVALVGLRAAIAAATLAGRCAQRIAAGLGPAAPGDADVPLDVDDERFDRQLRQLVGRAGDHETKVMLRAWGVPVTRQAVAATPSAATRLAKRAGFPVQVKPWSADAPPEPDGCPVEVDLWNAPDVRRAFVTVTREAGLPEGSPVIVRETPPAGREVRAQIVRDDALGWTAVVHVAGAPPVAAPAPLRAVDAAELVRAVEATRAGDAEPDRDALAELLVRASHMVAVHDDAFDRLDLARVIVAPRGEGAVVVDARASLSRRSPR
ncbi:MAG: hypothetical protein D6689_01845 [Deltaproteobacteria bacterium]|nr:MAG: hypothetical protein D6689_01845 [Deltaproteobacteria bacterium]